MITAIIQARINSTRLPGKVFERLGDKTILEHVVERVKLAKHIDDVIVATTKNDCDDIIADLCLKKNINYYRGSPEDVLSRYYEAAKKFKVKIVCRITSDCPFIDPEIIDKVADIYHEEDFDYVSTGRLKSTYPDGLDTEIFSFDVLRSAYANAKLLSEREHVTPYIWGNDKKFKIGIVNYKEDLSFMRWTVDEKSDLKFVRLVYDKLNGDVNFFNMVDILELLEKEPGLMKINSHIKNNEGYYKTLLNDSK